MNNVVEYGVIDRSPEDNAEIVKMSGAKSALILPAIGDEDGLKRHIQAAFGVSGDFEVSAEQITPDTGIVYMVDSEGTEIGKFLYGLISHKIDVGLMPDNVSLVSSRYLGSQIKQLHEGGYKGQIYLDKPLSGQNQRYLETYVSGFNINSLKVGSHSLDSSDGDIDVSRGGYSDSVSDVMAA